MYGIYCINCTKYKFFNILDRDIRTKNSQRYVPFTNVHSQISARIFSLGYFGYFGKLSDFSEILDVKSSLLNDLYAGLYVRLCAGEKEVGRESHWYFNQLCKRVYCVSLSI